MKKLLLIYWTGTFNTRYITSLLESRFSNEYEVTKIEVTGKITKDIDVSGYDLIGIGYPIYGFNVPCYFEKLIKHLKWNKNSEVFFYKDSGETMHANDASSYKIYNSLKRKKIVVKNEYHFLMPYNIHFRFEDSTIHEMLPCDDKLADILHYEVTNHIPNIKKYKVWQKFVTFNVALVHICGPVNSWIMKVDKKKCSDCGLCIKQCPRNNIYKKKKGKIKFHHHCETCMRCSLHCPKDALYMGFLQGWKVNGPYNLDKIKSLDINEPFIKEDTKGFFECYKETYNYINNRYKEIFGE